MGKIIVLDENTSNKIAAGEVVERPASVVKEMVENSIDAGATAVSVEIKNGGITYIKVTDNGYGIDDDDAELAFERHATSKIRSADDLESIATMGFRGEALASIAAVSTVELTTRASKSPSGKYILVQGGNVKEVRQIGSPPGTTFVVRNLFFNTPARFKFLKKDSTEAGYISDIMGRIALAKPDISLRLISNNKTVLHSPGNNDLLSAIYSVYGKETAKQVCKIDDGDEKLKVDGYAGKPEIARANRNQQSIFINGRYVKSKIVSAAIDEAYKTVLMKNKFAFIVLNIKINPMLIDVNVHPTKMEVRFSDEQEVFRSVYHAIENALLGSGQVKTVQLGERDRNIFKLEDSENKKPDYTQQNIQPQAYENRKEVPKPVVPEIPRTEAVRPETGAAGPEERLEQSKVFPEAVKVSGENMESREERKEIVTGYGKDKDEKVSLPEQPAIPKKDEVLPSGFKKPEDADKGLILQEEPARKYGNIIEECKLIGQVFSTYILLQYHDEMILIDQHAAHERIMYEKLRLKYGNNESLSQMLLAPVVIELTNRELKFLEEEKEFFTKIGFIYEEFGNNCIILRAIPYVMDNDIIKELFLDIVDSVINSGTGEYREIADNTLYTIACKSAVKANKRLDDLEVKSLLEGLSKLENPYTCPHGRPTILKITKYEIEKMFKRIV